MARRWIVGVALGPFAGAATAQDAPAAKWEAIAPLVEAVREETKVPAVSIAVVVDGDVPFARGFGWADLEHGVPATEATVYRIGSVSKTLTAVLALRLVELGKLDLNAPVQEYAKDFPEKRWTVTPHHLLTHRSGIRHWTLPEQGNKRRFRGVCDAAKLICDEPLLFEPGTDELYSTPAFNLLGCAIEGASGESYLDALREHVLDRADVETLRDDDAEAVIPNRARGYRLSRGELKRAACHDVSIKLPGGGLCGSVVDLGRFAGALLEGDLLSDETRARMWTPERIRPGLGDRRGYGCAVGSEKGRRVVWHVGGVPGASSVLYLAPDRGVAVAVLCNMQGVALFDLASAAADLALDED